MKKHEKQSFQCTIYIPCVCPIIQWQYNINYVNSCQSQMKKKQKNFILKPCKTGMPTVLFAQPPFSSVPLPSHGRQRLSLGPLGLLSVDPWQMFTSRDHEKRWKKGDFNTTAFRNSTIGCYFPIIGRYFKVDHPFIGDSLGKCLLVYHSRMIWI